MPAACSAVRTATRSVASLTTSNDVAEVVDLLGAGVEHRLEHVVLGDLLALLLLRDDDDALAVEQVRHRARVGHRAAVAGHRGADLHRGAVLVVGQALDQERDAVGAVALVHDRRVVGAAGLGTGAALDRAVDVVVRDRGLLRLLDGVVQRRVAVEVAAARPRRDLDVLDQLGEHLAALGVDDGLLVLRRRPLGMAGHSAVPSARRARLVDEVPVDAHGRRRRPRGGTTSPAAALPDGDDPTGGRAGLDRRAPRPRRPTCSTHGARMKTACTGSPIAVERRGRPRTSRPAGRTRCGAP